ncbi:MAG: DUF4349 domain-containing protein [Pseudolysinimonas sp.]|uniref:DUF4349 domain-containing protein n=1 Tax=Pseudolysinimonas sp. TaxID=2680009 RepID=UPI0032636180
MKRISVRGTILGSGLLAAMLLLAGCSGAAGGSTTYDSGVSAPVPAPGGVVSEAGGASGDLDVTAQDRSVIVTGSMTVTADDPTKASRDAVKIVEAAGGRIDGQSIYAPTNGDKGGAQLTLRIPADKLQSVIDQLSALGRADEITTSSTDVTLQVADLDSRIATQTGIIARLNGLLAQATSIQDLIDLETQIAEHQGELESLQAQQRATADQVALSTLSLSLRSDADAPVQAPLDFVTGLQAGWGAFVGFFSGLLVALGVLLPWLITAGLMVVLTVWIVRRRRRRDTPSSAS